MASQIVGELRRGSGAIRKQGKGEIVLTMQVDFLVVADDKFASREDILLNTPNAPIVGLNYGPLNIPCVGKNATRNETNPLYWELSCEFDSSFENQESDPNNPSNPDPTAWIPIWTLELSVEDGSTLTHDTNFTPIRNTAGEYYEDLPKARQRLISWTFNQFEPASLSALDIALRHMTVNSVGFSKTIRGVTTTWDQYAFLLQVENAELGYYMGFLCWNIKYRLTYKRNMWTSGNLGWQTLTFSRGWNYLDQATGKLKPWIKDGINIYGPLQSNGDKDTAAGALGHEQIFLFYKPLDFRTFLR